MFYPVFFFFLPIVSKSHELRELVKVNYKNYINLPILHLFKICFKKNV